MTYEENIGSRRVMEKSGLRLVRAFRTSLANVQTADTYDGSAGDFFDGDDVEYALDRAEWERGEGA
jgi:RimJ/RimL family protein N-acetyltransferase